jgi:hypothetical protein
MQYGHPLTPPTNEECEKYLESTGPGRADHGQLTGMHNIAASIQRCLGLLCQSAFAPCHACARARRLEGVSASWRVPGAALSMAWAWTLSVDGRIDLVFRQHVFPCLGLSHVHPST